MDNITYKIYTQGCKVNQYDSLTLDKELHRVGLSLNKEDPNIIFLNTCAVTKVTLRKLRTNVNRIRRDHPGAKMIIIGCAARAYPEYVEKLQPDMVWGVGDYNKLINQISNIKFQISEQIDQPKRYLKFDNRYLRDRSRYFIKIQDGCDQFCTYCIVPYTRGSKIVSRPAAEAVAEIEAACARGYEEVVLSGIHLGKYAAGGKKGKVESEKHKTISTRPFGEAPAHFAHPADQRENVNGDGSGLLILLKELVRIKELKRIRLSSIEVTEVSDGLIAFMARERKLCRHLHIPLQSGCDKILRSMNRPYDQNGFEIIISKIRGVMPDIAISTDVIAGFPGETDDDFEQTKKFIKKIGFSRVHSFSFSPHERTPAAHFPGQNDPKTIASRSRDLQALSAELEKKYRNKFAGKELEIIVERIQDGKAKGKTEYYFDIGFNIREAAKKEVKIGKILKIRLNPDVD